MPESADLLLAADVLVYIGDLSAVFSGAARVLSARGLFAFTVQQAEDAFALGPDLRFAHAPAYIEAEAGKAGLRILKMEAAVTRQDGNRDVPGLVVVAQKG